MKITDFFSLLGGLALFLYGMQMMSNGLEAAAGNRMKQILEKLTANRFLGVLVGAGITAVIQSSSATTVMVVGFVNSVMMTLRQAVWIIMGANIGTTITGQLIALDIGEVAPLLAFAGVALIMFTKKKKVHHIGLIVAGLGVLFIGMGMMSSSMMPLRESEAFISLMTRFSNPVLGILAGMVFTAIIQSSSASVGILQALAASGLIGLDSAVFVLFGQNIGTCITAVLASIGTKTNAKRATVIHLMFNIFGSILFTFISMLTPFVSWVEALSPGNTVAQIANVHTIFNIVTTLILLPVGTYMAKLAVLILPEEKEETIEERGLKHIKVFENSYSVGNEALALSELEQEVDRMRGMVAQNIEESYDAVLTGNLGAWDSLKEREEYIDYLNAEISKYIVRQMSGEKSVAGSKSMSSYYIIVGNIERIGDHAMNILGYAKNLNEWGIHLSQEALEEVRQMKKICEKALADISMHNGSRKEFLEKAARNEQKIDDLEEMYLKKQIERMKSGSCNAEAGILFSELLTDFERIGDHVLNIAEQYQNMAR